ncbi:MAG: hypothetical protein ACYCZZ_00215 [Minisyncoccota bacterium]
MWQDYLLTAVQAFFCLTLIPMLLAKEKPPLASSVSTGLTLLISAAVFMTLHFWLTAISQTVVGIQWLTLAYQKRYILRK